MKQMLAAALLILLGIAVTSAQWQIPQQPAAANLPHTVPSQQPAPTSAGTQAGNSQTAAVAEPSERQQGTQTRQRQHVREQLQQLQQAKTAGNLQQWLHRFWLHCQRLSAAQCAAELALYQAELSSAEAAWLQQLLARYGDYQQLLGELVMTEQLDKPTQYDEVRKLRQRIFADDYDVLFGQEQQWAGQQFSYAELLSQRSQMDAAQRLDALFMQQQQLPQQLRALVSADLLYQQALDMLADLPATERRQWQQQLREHYFGEQAQDIARHEEQQYQQQQTQQAYLAQRTILEQQFSLSRQQLLAQNAAATELALWQQQYAQALAELRQLYFP